MGLASLAAGTMLLGALAGLIREHGLGNDYGALLVGGALLDVVRPVLDGPVSLADLLDGGHALGLAALAVIAALTAGAMRWRIAGDVVIATTDDDRAPALRLPASGVAPIGNGGGRSSGLRRPWARMTRMNRPVTRIEGMSAAM